MKLEDEKSELNNYPLMGAALLLMSLLLYAAWLHEQF